MCATLWVVATPLGNLGDFSPRARQVLEEVQIILAEDTRRAAQLLHWAEIRAKKIVSLHEHNETQRIATVLDWLQAGQGVALISDAGTPLIADPGYRLVAACRAQGLPVVPVPGPCAPIAALMASGLPPYPFVFLGFLPRKTGAIQDLLRSYAHLQITLVFFERKNRVLKTLDLAHAVLGDREFCLARELTKKHEQFIKGDLGQPLDRELELLGEFTVIIGPPAEMAMTCRAEVLAMLPGFLSDNKSLKDVARQIQSQSHGWSAKQVYALLLEYVSEAE